MKGLLKNSPFVLMEVKMKQRGFEIVTTYQGQFIHLPRRRTVASAGYDIESAVNITLEPQKVTLIPTGLKAYMQSDEYLGIHIRSGFSIKQNVILINGQGVIDADYYNNIDNEGHIMIAVFNLSAQVIQIEKGMRIAQGIFYKYLLTDDDDAKGVRAGGMGSTGA